MLRSLAILVVSLVLVAIFAAAVLLFPILPFGTIENAQRHDTAVLCLSPTEDCSPQTGQTVKLPYHGAPDVTSRLHRARFVLYFGQYGPDEDVTGVYLPKFSDSLSVSVNGVPLTSERSLGPDQIFHHAHRPYFVTVPNAILMPKDNELTIDLGGYGFQRLSLYPVYSGQEQALDFSLQVEKIFLAGMPRINFALSVSIGLALLIFGLVWRRDPMFFWLSAASLAGAAMSFQWVYLNFSVNDRIWAAWWSSTVALQVFFTLNFVISYVKARILWLRLLGAAVVIAGAAGLLFAPFEMIRTIMIAFQLATLGMAIAIVAVLTHYRGRLNIVNFAVLFSLYSLAIGLALSEWVSHYVIADWTPIFTAPFIPAVLVISLLWIVFFQLYSLLSRYEDLTKSQQTTIRDRSEELQRTYQKLAQQAQFQAIETERQRILLDLHDGVGGQLVNTLAYMATQPEQDPVLQTALEDALRDMGLIIDSLEAGDSVATQLGLLRGRLEPLLEKHTIQLKWQIGDDPDLPVSGPSQSLAVLRIVQEAITNAVKHANARCIAVSTTARTIAVVDDGLGFDAQNSGRQAGSGTGIGVAGMKRRADTLGIQLRIDSSGKGTAVTLSW